MTGFATIEEVDTPSAEYPIPRPGDTSYTILLAVADAWKGSAYGPTVEEIRKKVGLSSRSGVQFHISNLLDAGWLDNIPNRRRTLQVTNKGKKLIKMFESISNA